MMIEVQELTKHFGSTVAVDRITFGVDRGEIVGLLGPNGAGKTTTMRILTCILPATSGTAHVAGFDCRQQSLDVRRRVGYLPENVPLYPEMRVREYLDYRAKLKEIPRKQRRARVDYCMQRCGISDVARKLNGALSKGYRQRVGLADAMLHDPDLLILDEPTVGLDPIQIRQARQLIKELGEQHTILVSTHILPEVEMICERVLMIADGRIALDDKLENLQRDAVITLEARGPKEKVRGVLETTDGVSAVQEVTSRDGLAAFEIRTENDQDLREVLSERMVTNGWTIRHLDLRRRTLEDHFVQAVLSVEHKAAV